MPVRRSSRTGGATPLEAANAASIRRDICQATSNGSRASRWNSRSRPCARTILLPTLLPILQRLKVEAKGSVSAWCPLAPAIGHLDCLPVLLLPLLRTRKRRASQHSAAVLLHPALRRPAPLVHATVARQPRVGAATMMPCRTTRQA